MILWKKLMVQKRRKTSKGQHKKAGAEPKGRVPKRKTAGKNQKTLDSYMQRPGWTPLKDLQHRGGIMLSYREAGGGGDCMFHSLAAVLGGGETFETVRSKAASMVTPENAPDVLMDMTAQMPKSLADQMDEIPGTNGGQFVPERLWNASKGSREAMADGLRRAIRIPGNFLWGDATTASLVESAANVNVILLAVDTGVKIPPTAKEIVLARTIFGQWVQHVLNANPKLASKSKDEILADMSRAGLTWARAVSFARAEVGGGQGKWLRGRRQPLGSVREMCQNDPNSGNISIRGYRDDRPTVIIWNRSNAHWVPIAVGPFAETIIMPNTPLRAYVDELMK